MLDPLTDLGMLGSNRAMPDLEASRGLLCVLLDCKIVPVLLEALLRYALVATCPVIGCAIMLA